MTWKWKPFNLSYVGKLSHQLQILNWKFWCFHYSANQWPSSRRWGLCPEAILVDSIRPPTERIRAGIQQLPVQNPGQNWKHFRGIEKSLWMFGNRAVMWIQSSCANHCCHVHPAQHCPAAEWPRPWLRTPTSTSTNGGCDSWSWSRYCSCWSGKAAPNHYGIFCLMSPLVHCQYHGCRWPVEWVIKFNGFFRTTDSEVHVNHISHVIMTYTLDSISSLT